LANVRLSIDKLRSGKTLRNALIETKMSYMYMCLCVNMISTAFLIDHFIFNIQGVSGPSMKPTLDPFNNLLIVDRFTHRFLRPPRKGEIIIALNPFKPGVNVVKRVLYTEGEMAEFMDLREGRLVKVQVPSNHVWVEGDNKSNSRDSRDYGPLSLELIHGIARYRVWPIHRLCKLQ
jgi:mitochondrial inner membrane protease subunit 1